MTTATADLVLDVGVRRAIGKLREGDPVAAELCLVVALTYAEAIEAKAAT